METVALILAAGCGARFGGEVPKQYRNLAGQPVLRRAVRAFLNHPSVDAVRVVIGPKDHPAYQSALGDLPLLSPVVGGMSRQQSGRLGLESIQADTPRHVLIHDAARPCLPAVVIDRVLDALSDTPAAVPALPVADTIKRSDHRGFGNETVDRKDLWRAQTPQGFHYARILAAHRAATDQNLTDDAAVAAAAGLAVRLVEGSVENIKLTTAEDLRRAEYAFGDAEMRVGNGVDVHRFGPGDAVTLCGVSIPHGHGLSGHSDADVGWHALTDAILGALSDGDIGEHFPPTDEQWRGADSAIFLAHAAARVAAAGGEISHVDITMICQAPKLAPHRQAMRERTAAALGLPLRRVSVKATTTEGLGFTGRGEGIAAQATATLRLYPGWEVDSQ